jgi:alpha-galactosidase
MRTNLRAALVAALLTVAGAAAVQLSSAAPASALDNGLAKTPPMGWNDWNAFGCNVSAALVEQTAQAIVSSGLRDAGYSYVNIDDCWAMPNRDANGNLVPNPMKFPDGIKAVADFVHALGLKLGIYEDSGTKTCSSSGGFSGSLGQENADALEFAQWGVDYLKYDDCNQPADQQNIPATIARYTAMRDALAAATAQTGQPIVFSICEKTDFGVPNSAWPTIGNLWRTTGDIHDQYSRMVSLFHTNVQLASLAGPGAWNDPDMLEIGNGGQTDAEYRSEFSLWSEMAAPLIAGTDLRSASPATLAIYSNKEVIAVDQDPLGKQGTIVSSSNGHWVLTKPLANGDVAVTLFNETDTPATIATTASAAGLGHSQAYAVRDLWQHATTETAGNITAVVAPHATEMYRISLGADPDTVPPHTAFSLTGLDSAQPGQPTTVTETLTNDGRIPAENVQLTLDAPSDWTVRATSTNTFAAVLTGRTVTATWQATEPEPDQPFPAWTLSAKASYVWGPSSTAATASAAQTITRPSPVQAPYRTFASTTAQFGQGGDTLGIRAAGSDVFGATNQYGSIYLRNAEQDGTAETVELTEQAATSDWAKSGIMVRNDISQSGSSPGFVILAASPGHGYVLQWDSNGDGQLDSSSAPMGEGTGTTVYPSRLRLTRSGTTFTGSYSTDGSTWTQIGSADVASAATNQDTGVFTTAHSTAVGEADFANFAVGPPSGSVDAPRSVVTLPGQAATVAATLYDHGGAGITAASATLSAPAGWTVTPTMPIDLGDVAAGDGVPASWQVTAPADAPAGPVPLTITATYQDAGHEATSTATVTAVVPSADLSSAYNNVGITDDTNTSVGNIDGAGSSLSAQALAAVGVSPGSPVSHGGMQFAWPNVPAGQQDNVVASGQSFKLSGTGTSVGFLATATYGPASGTGTVTYTDGTTQQFALSVPDWFANPPSGSDPAITMTYRNRSGNTQQVHAINVFLVKVALQPGKTPGGLTLPNASGPPVSGVPSMHIFGIALG